MGRTENDPNPTCAESIDSCAVSFDLDEFGRITDWILHFLLRLNRFKKTQGRFNLQRLRITGLTSLGIGDTQEPCLKVMVHGCIFL